MALTDKLHLGNHHKAPSSGSGTTTPAAGAGEQSSSAAGSPTQTPPPMTSSPTSTSGASGLTTSGPLSYFSRHASDRIQQISGKAASLAPFRNRKSGDNASGRSTPTHGGDVVESPSPASEDETPERAGRSRSTSPKNSGTVPTSRQWGSFHARNRSRARRSSSKQRTQVAPPSWPPEEWFLPHTTPPPRPKMGGNASSSSKSVAFESEEDGAEDEEANGFDKEATPTPGYGFGPASGERTSRGAETLGTSGKTVLPPREGRQVTAEPASMTAQEEMTLSKTASGRPQLGKLQMDGAGHGSTEPTPTVGTAPSTKWNDRQDEEEEAESGQDDNDDFAVCDSPGATQSLAPQPRGASPVSSAGEADDERSAGLGRRQASLDAASVMIMDSPSATQSIDIEEMLRRRRLDAENLQRQIDGLDISDKDDERKRTMATTASFDPNADPQVFDSPSHTQNIDPGMLFGPPPVSARQETPSSSHTLRGDPDDARGEQSPSSHSSGPSKSASLEHQGHHHQPKTSLPHHVAHLSHKIAAHLPHPTRHLPPTPPSGPMSTSSSTSPPSLTSSTSHRSQTTTSGTSSPGSTSRQGGGARPATPQKMWRPPQHPDIVKKQQGGERMIKETLDATSGKTEEGQRMVNQYIFRQEVGRGSFGAVQLAQDAETGRECAIKVFSKARMRRKMRAEWMRNGLPDDDEQTDALYLIRNEVAIMKKVNHPNVVALYEVLDVEGEDNLYMVMEYCRGGPIMKVEPGQEGAALELEKARRYFRQMVVGVDYLHQNEIIHHDIKPDNILLTSDQKTCKITDFGVSAMFDRPGDDSSSRAMGSPAFASPELCGRPVDHIRGTAADIWAMGVTLYCMLDGQLPFGRGGQIVEMYEEIKEAAPPIPEEWEPSLCDLMVRLLDKDQETRIKMAELRDHPWVTANGLRPLPAASENSKPVGPITETDVRHSFRHAISSKVEGFRDVLEASIAASRKHGETHEHGRRREFFKEFYRQISARSAEKHGHSRSLRHSRGSSGRQST